MNTKNAQSDLIEYLCTTMYHYDVYMLIVFEDPLFYLINIQIARLLGLKNVLRICHIRCLNELEYNKAKYHKNIADNTITYVIEYLLKTYECIFLNEHDW